MFAIPQSSLYLLEPKFLLPILLVYAFLILLFTFFMYFQLPQELFKPTTSKIMSILLIAAISLTTQVENLFIHDKTVLEIINFIIGNIANFFALYLVLSSIIYLFDQYKKNRIKTRWKHALYALGVIIILNGWTLSLLLLGLILGAQLYFPG